jgi:uncharacterized protein YaaR (DUF327 family)
MTYIFVVQKINKVFTDCSAEQADVAREFCRLLICEYLDTYEKEHGSNMKTYYHIKQVTAKLADLVKKLYKKTKSGKN